MSPYLTLFNQLHTQIHLPNGSYQVPLFPRNDLGLLYLQTPQEISIDELRQSLESKLIPTPRIEPYAYRCLIYLLPTNITNDMKDATFLRSRNWQQHALFIRGAAIPQLKHTAQEKLRNLLVPALESILNQPVYRESLRWKAKEAQQHMDTYDILQQHDPKLAELEYQEE